MSDDYTPETEEVRETYADATCIDLDDPAHAHGCPQDAEFDRWLASVKADAWDEAIGEAAEQGTIQIPTNPYRR